MVNRNVDWFYFQGKSSWARVHTPDLEYRNWSIKVHLKPESIELFKKLKETENEVEGILNTIARDDDGEYVTFKRPMSKNWGRGEEAFTPPEVIDADGKPTKEEIGNGSDVTIKVERYKYKKPFGKGRGSAIRMVAVRVDNLVPYARSDYSPNQEHAVKGLDEQPKQLF